MRREGPLVMIAIATAGTLMTYHPSSAPLGARSVLQPPQDERCEWLKLASLPGDGLYHAAVALDPGEVGVLGDEVLYVHGGLRKGQNRTTLNDDLFKIELPIDLRRDRTVVNTPVQVLPALWGHAATLARFDDPQQPRKVILWSGGSNELPEPLPTPVPATPTPRLPTLEASASARAPRDRRTSNLAVPGGATIQGAVPSGAHRTDAVAADATSAEASGAIYFTELGPGRPMSLNLLATGVRALLNQPSAWLPPTSTDNFGRLILHSGRDADDANSSSDPDNRWTLINLRLPFGSGATQSTLGNNDRLYGHTMVAIDALDLLVFGGGRDDASIGKIVASDLVRAYRVPGASGQAPVSFPLTINGRSPARRLFHAAAWQSKRRRMVVYGGSKSLEQVDLGILGDTWVLEQVSDWTMTWRELVAPGGPAVGRTAATMVYDPDHDVLILVGGLREDTSFNEIHALECRLEVSTPTPTATHTATTSPTPSATATATPSATSTATPIPTSRPSVTPTPTEALASPTPTARSWLILLPRLIRYPLMRDTRCALEEVEPNQNRAEAQFHAALPRDVFMCGWLPEFDGEKDDSDIFWFDVPESGLLYVWMTDIPFRSRYDVYLYDRDGRAIDCSDEPYCVRNATPDPNRSTKNIGASVVGGMRYFVLVKAVSGHSPYPYRLRWHMPTPLPHRADEAARSDWHRSLLIGASGWRSLP